MPRLLYRWPFRVLTLALLLVAGLFLLSPISWWGWPGPSQEGPTPDHEDSADEAVDRAGPSLRGHEFEGSPGISMGRNSSEPKGLLEPTPAAAGEEFIVLSGRVVDVTGRPAEGVRVGVGQEWFGSSSYAVVELDEKGTFTLETAHRSVCAVWLSGPGWANTVVEVFPGPEVAVIRATRAGRIEGVALDRSTGEPVRGIRIRALPLVQAARHWVYEARTNEQGRFVFESLVPGEYAICTRNLSSVLEEPEADWIPYFSEHVCTGTFDLNVELARGLTIRGTVRAPLGGQLPERVVVSTTVPYDGSAEYAWPLRRRIDPDGTFSLRGLAPGRYALEVLPVGGERLGVVWLEDIEAGTCGLVIDLPHALTMEIRLVSTSPDGFGLEGQVLVHPSGCTSDDREWIQAEAVDVGLYRAIHLNPQSAYDIEARGFSGHSPTVLRAVRPSPSGVTVELTVGGTITCVVLDEQGDRVTAKLPVIASAQGLPEDVPTDDGNFVRAQSSANGTVTFRGLGDHAFRISAGGGNSGFASAGFVDGVRPGATDVELRVERGVRLAGRLVDARGRSVSTFCLRARSIQSRGGLGDFVAVGVDGRFEFEGVPAGALELVATIDGAARPLGRFSAPAAELVVVVGE